MKFCNGREIKENDPVVGLDYAGRLFSGVALKGDGGPHQREFIVRHGKWGTVSPDLNLNYFLHAEDAAGVKDENAFRAACKASASATAEAE